MAALDKRHKPFTLQTYTIIKLYKYRESSIKDDKNILYNVVNKNRNIIQHFKITL